MTSPICAMLGVDFPLVAFSHCRDVVAAVSRAGGFGVLGAPLRPADKAVAGGAEVARELVTYFVGQGVGLVDAVRPAGQVVQDFKREFAEAVEGMQAWVS